MKWIITLVALLAISCTNKQAEVGEYVYVDILHTIHIDRECASSHFENLPSEETSWMYMYRGVEFVKTPCVDTIPNASYCPKCIDDKAYNEIQSIIKKSK